MTYLKSPDGKGSARLAALLLIVASFALAGAGCRTKSRVSVAPLLTPLERADAARLFEEVNRVAAVQSVRGKIDVQFLDTSFAECGIADKYRTADGEVVLQRPGQIYLAIKAPFGVKIAEMTSNGEKFWVAVYQGEERYRRFAYGRNEADYGRLSADGNGGANSPCGDGDQRDAKTMQRTVSSLSSLRPQHLTDAFMVRPVTAPNSNLVYAQSESFEDEPDVRPGAKKNARVVRGYYILVELEPMEQGRARITRRFWFDRVGGIRLARVQNYDETGQLTTDVVYRDPKAFGPEGRFRLSGTIELTRPQDRYSLRIAFQAPDDVTIDNKFDPEIFVLPNSSGLPEVDLDKQVKP